jgi:hypothetical protein
MAQKLMMYYAMIEKEGGLGAKIKLATQTRIPSVKAATAPDSPENIDAFRNAYARITGKPAPFV